MTTYIGTSRITQPCYFGRQVKETTTRITLEIVGLDFSPKTSGTGLTHKFSKGEQKFFTDILVGQTRTYRKSDGKQIGGGESFLILGGRS